MNNLDKLPIPLLLWYEENARDLPWRQSPDPYRVWVSEIMLQQTRVAAVLGYFERFMAAFPTIRDLAEAPEDALMKLWQGLGYYSRARNLQKAARQIMDHFGGCFPDTYDKLITLAGIGDYTASAIASISFGAPLPAVDGNLLRVAARIGGDEDDITTPAMKKKVSMALGEIIPKDYPGTFNQAMMDLGAMICLPNGAPLCDRCPACAFCAAHLTGRTDVIPVRSKKKARRIEERDVFFLFHEQRVALRRRPPKGLLAGLWEFPCELSSGEGDPRNHFHLPHYAPVFAGVGKHIFTHVEWHMRAFVLLTQEDALPEGWVWADQTALEETYPVPNAFASFLPILDGYL